MCTGIAVTTGTAGGSEENLRTQLAMQGAQGVGTLAMDTVQGVGSEVSSLVQGSANLVQTGFRPVTNFVSQGVDFQRQTFQQFLRNSFFGKK